MNLTAIYKITGDIGYHNQSPNLSKRQSLQRSMKYGKTRPKENSLLIEERINLNENALKSLYVS